MSHGHPDYGLEAAKQTIHAVTDYGELAAMLGSIATFDRRGDVIFLDDFEENIHKWDRTLEGDGARIGLSSTTARNGGLCCKITTGDTTGDTEQMSRYLSYPVLSKMGLEISMALHSFASPVIMQLHTDDGTTWTVGGLRYYPNTDTLQYLDSGGVYQTITNTLALYLDVHCFHTFKLVIDLVNGRYTRAIVGPHAYDLSAYPLFTGAFLVHNFLGINIIAEARRDGNEDMYVEDVIITQNEP